MSQQDCLPYIMWQAGREGSQKGGKGSGAELLRGQNVCALCTSVLGKGGHVALCPLSTMPNGVVGL